ncbi:hypothetical protein JTE90_005544 [Oedothorax gibbosus]|uniref:Gustatory receptor n=1 Tax=Oedothorax gibbosus TaxID=931172 RepID=A0AAV6VB43_9ARAC|nr:hypothetical protein JTE90_005544 [Oedothorax gibbosus]
MYVVPPLATIMLCYIFYTLGSLVSDYKTEVTRRYPNSSFTASNYKQLTISLRRLSKAITDMDKIISPATMILLASFVFQILLFTSVLHQQSNNMFHQISAGFLTVSLLVALTTVVVLAARVQEKVSEMEDALLDVAISDEQSFSDNCTRLDQISFSQVMATLANKTHMTAMSVFKIEKSLIITLLCAFITYSVLLNQILSN